MTLRAVWGTTAPSQTSLIRTCTTTRSTGNSQATRKPKLVVGAWRKITSRPQALYTDGGGRSKWKQAWPWFHCPHLTRSSKPSRQGEEKQAVATAEVPLSPRLHQGYPADAYSWHQITCPPEAGCFLATESESQSDASFPDRGGLMWELGINSK